MKFIRWHHRREHHPVQRFVVAFITPTAIIRGYSMSFKVTKGAGYALAVTAILDAAGVPTKPLAAPTYAVSGSAITINPATDGLSAGIDAVAEGAATLTVTIDGVAQSFDFVVAAAAPAPAPQPGPVASFTVTLTDSTGNVVANS